jgi:hypothetical protein
VGFFVPAAATIYKNVGVWENPQAIELKLVCSEMDEIAHL